jgi:hypothetical protein
MYWDCKREEDDMTLKSEENRLRPAMTLLLLSLMCLFLLILQRCGYGQTGPIHVPVPGIPVLTIAYEASGETLEGQVAVASVIKTRMRERGQTAEEVCLAPHQFSCWRDGKPAQLRELRQKELKTAQKAWTQAKAGPYNHYCRYDCKPYWVKAAKRSVRIGDHIFYEL